VEQAGDREITAWASNLVLAWTMHDMRMRSIAWRALPPRTRTTAARRRVTLLAGYTNGSIE
jgi:hypothetical protein